MKNYNLVISGHSPTGGQPVPIDDLPEPPAWTIDALCAQTDPEAFFPEKGGSTRNAKTICASCDVREQCLAYAIANDERFGIWGGLSERERRKLRPAGGSPRGAVAREAVKRLHALDQIDTQIAAALDVEVHYVWRTRKLLGLPSNFARKSA